jgi:MFS family permease
MPLRRATAGLTSRLYTTLPVPFFYGWVVLGVATLGVFLSGPAQTYGVSVFITPMLDELGWSRSTISAAYSAATLLAGISMLAFGPFLDRLGARRVVAGIALLYGAACIGMALVHSPLALFAGFTALRVIGSAALVLSCTTLAALWFVRRRGRAMSVTVLGMALSNAVVPPLLQLLVNQYGWRVTWAIAGVLVWLLLTLPAVFLIRNRPEAVGLQPDGGAATRKLGREGAEHWPVEYHWTAKQAMRTRTFWLLVLATVGPGTVHTGLIFHQAALFAERGLPAELSATALTVSAVAFALMTFIAGGFLDRVPERYVLMAGLLLLPVGAMWLMVVTTPFQALVYGALQGTAIGTNATTGSVLWAAYYGRRSLGSIRGVTQAAVAAGAATGPLILGVPFDFLGSYTPGLWIMVAIPVVCALAALLAGSPAAPPEERRKIGGGEVPWTTDQGRRTKDEGGARAEELVTD